MSQEEQRGKVDFDFTGRRYVVTGASSGIGRAIALRLASSGAAILAVARREAELRTLAQECPGQIEWAAVDVTDSASLATALEAFGAKGKIHGSVHAAGFAAFSPLRAFEKRQAEAMMAVSLWAGVELVRILSRKKYAAAGAAHLFLASVAAERGQIGLSAYGATKSAVVGAVRSLSRELARQGGRINALSPGWVDTSLTKGAQDYTLQHREVMEAAHPLGLGQEEYIVQPALFLLSDGAKWMTGANVVVDGGYSA